MGLGVFAFFIVVIYCMIVLVMNIPIYFSELKNTCINTGDSLVKTFITTKDEIVEIL